MNAHVFVHIQNLYKLCVMARDSRINKSLKSHLTSCAMMEAETYSENENVSGRRGRNPVNGQYMSMDRGNSNTSYADGYSRGYSEAMAQNQSGYSYMYPPRPYHY